MLSKGTWPEALKNLKFGTNTHYSQFEADGTLTMGGDASVFNDIMLSALALRIGSTDAFTGNAFILQVGAHYEANTLGSRSIYLK